MAKPDLDKLRTCAYDHLAYDAVQLLLSHGHVYPPRLRYMKNAVDTVTYLNRLG